MENIAWESKYETGVEDIDLQHHYFLNLINHFITAVKNKENAKTIKALGSELDAYARFHFSSEERMMIRSDYPNYEQHKKHHFDLIERLSIEAFKLTNISNTDDISQIVEFLIQWFVNHTTHEDKMFANYLLQRDEKAL